VLRSGIPTQVSRKSDKCQYREKSKAGLLDVIAAHHKRKDEQAESDECANNRPMIQQKV
jgi:hypothetical protein